MAQADSIVSVNEFIDLISQGQSDWSDPPHETSDVVFCVTTGVLQGRTTGTPQLVPTKLKDRSPLTTQHLSWSRMRTWLKRLGADHCQVSVDHFSNGRTVLCPINGDIALRAVCNVILQLSGTRTIHVNLCSTRSILHSSQSSDDLKLYRSSKESQALSSKKRGLIESHCRPGRETKRARIAAPDAQQNDNPMITQLQEVIGLIQQHYIDAIEDLNTE